LNNGAQWIPNIETTQGVSRMLKLVSSQIDAEDLTLYSEIGKTLNLEMKTVFAQCTMQGKGHDQLHLFLIPLVKQFRGLEHVETEEEAINKLAAIKTHLNGYTTYFK
jgi:hypothetical protein